MTVKFIKWTLGVALLLCIWCNILAPLYYCPSKLSDSSSNPSNELCPSYLVARSHIDTYIIPYYREHGEKYVQVVHPYVQKVNERVYVPISEFTKRKYRAHGEPRVDIVLSYVRNNWQYFAEPRIRSLKNTAILRYNNTIFPHVKQVVSTAALYQRALIAHASFVHGFIVRKYHQHADPIVRHIYHSGRLIFIASVLPHIERGWLSYISFMNGTVRPFMTGLYTKNVEPQLVKISQKLASYKEGRKVRGTVTGLTASPTATKSVFSGGSNTSERTTNTQTPPSEETLTPEQQYLKARKQIIGDLGKWQARFSVAASKGVEDLKKQVTDIALRRADSGWISRGKNHLNALQSAREWELEKLRVTILDIVRSMPNNTDPEDQEKALASFDESVKICASKIRESAHSLRKWFNELEYELRIEVNSAVDTTVEVLGSVWNLGLQQIGMKWAWMDAVTYKDWESYHGMKKQLSNWQQEVGNIGFLQNDLVKVYSEAASIIEQGMDIATLAATELSKLKAVGQWKIKAEDTSDSFEPKSDDPSTIRQMKRNELDLNPKSVSKRAAKDISSNALVQNTSGISTPLEQSSKNVAKKSIDLDWKNFDDAKTAVGDIITDGAGIEETSMTSASDVPSRSSSSILAQSSPKTTSSVEPVLKSDRAKTTRDNSATLVHAPVLGPMVDGIILDGERRYYEALDLAYEASPPPNEMPSKTTGEIVSTTTSGPSSTALASPTPSSGIETEKALSEYSAVSSLISKSLDSVLYSVSSVAAVSSSANPESALSIVSDASSRYSDALSAASMTLEYKTNPAAKESSTTQQTSTKTEIIQGEPTSSLLSLLSLRAPAVGNGL